MPSPTQFDAADERLAYAVRGRNRCLCFARLKARENGLDMLWRQLGVWMLAAIGRSMSAARDHVSGVVQLGAFPEMVKAHTSPIVAAMENIQAFGNRATGEKLERETVGLDWRLGGHLKEAVSARSRPSPLPAARLRGGDVPKEPNDGWRSPTHGGFVGRPSDWWEG